jgi:hypothetical protein
MTDNKVKIEGFNLSDSINIMKSYSCVLDSHKTIEEFICLDPDGCDKTDWVK